MSNTIKLTSSNVILMRRISSLVAVISSVACFAMLLLGFIPFYNQGASLITVLSNIFCIFDIFSKSFWPCFCKIAFACIYVFAAVRMLKDIISAIKGYGKWFVERHDLSYGRERATFCVKVFNKSLLLLICLFVFSSFASSYRLSSAKNAVIIILLAVNFLVNATRLLYLKRNILEAVAVPASVALMMYSIIVFNFGVSSFEIYSFFNSIGNLLRLLANTDFLGFTLNILTTQIVTPIFHLITLISLMLICDSACDHTFMDETVINKSKAFAIRNFVFIGITLLLKGFMNEYREFDKYIDLILNETAYIIISAFIWMASYSTRITALDAPLEETKAEDTTTSASPAAESAEAATGAVEDTTESTVAPILENTEIQTEYTSEI